MSDSGTMTLAMTVGGALINLEGRIAGLPAGLPQSGLYTCSIGWTTTASGTFLKTDQVFLSGVCVGCTFIVGAAVPTAGHTITLVSKASGVDVLSNLGANLGSATSATKAPGIILQETGGATGTMPRSMDGVYTLQVAGAGNSKSGTIELQLKR